MNLLVLNSLSPDNHVGLLEVAANSKQANILVGIDGYKKLKDR
jgi:hypothetical protein